MTIARTALPVAAHSLFDYWLPAGIGAGPGSVVRVRLGPRTLTGVVVEVAEVSAVAREKLLPITEVLAVPRLPADLLELARFVAGYYQESLGLVLTLMLPPVGAHDVRLPASAPQQLVLTDEGVARLPLRLTRAPRARALFDAWRAAPGAILEPDAFRALPAHLRATIRTWSEAGWVVPAGPGVPRHAAIALNPDQQLAAAAIIAARGTFSPFLL